MTALIRKLAARRRADKPALPPLVRTCRICKGEKMFYNAEIDDWQAEVDEAERAYEEANPGSTVDFYSTYLWKGYERRQPPEFVECVDCDGTGEELTPTGQQIVSFLRSRGVTFTIDI